jgi:hypothetical protein
MFNEIEAIGVALAFAGYAAADTAWHYGKGLSVVESDRQAQALEDFDDEHEGAFALLCAAERAAHETGPRNGPLRVLRAVEAGFCHSLARRRLSGSDRIDADLLVIQGLLRLVPRRGRFPLRYVVTATGSHRLGSFASVDRTFDADSSRISRQARAARAA